jgi:hypothetical protein
MKSPLASKAMRDLENNNKDALSDKLKGNDCWERLMSYIIF